MKWFAWGFVVLCSCAHRQLSTGALLEVARPAFVSRLVDGAGPQSHVFRNDSSYTPKLKQLTAAEGDRRLAAKLSGMGSMTGFQLADSLRASVVDGLPQQRPWNEVVNPADVARVLETFLVRQESTREPDYNRLKTLGADAVVELVVEEYGMRSQAGRAGVFMKGTARMFRLDGGTLYIREFISDESTAKTGVPPLDPFLVAKDPSLFRERLSQMVADVAALIAKDLNPGGWTSERTIEAPKTDANAPEQPTPSRADDPL
jgi:hypothetical protein